MNAYQGAENVSKKPVKRFSQVYLKRNSTSLYKVRKAKEYCHYNITQGNVLPSFIKILSTNKLGDNYAFGLMQLFICVRKTEINLVIFSLDNFNRLQLELYIR